MAVKRFTKRNRKVSGKLSKKQRGGVGTAGWRAISNSVSRKYGYQKGPGLGITTLGIGAIKATAYLGSKGYQGARWTARKVGQGVSAMRTKYAGWKAARAKAARAARLGKTSSV